MGKTIGNRGSALVIAMLLLVILTALGLYAVSISTSEFEMSTYTKMGKVALYAAEAGAYFGIDTIPIMTNANGISLANVATYDIVSTSVGAEPIPGYDTGWSRALFNIRSTGKPPSQFSGHRSIDAGAAYGPVPTGTGY